MSSRKDPNNVEEENAYEEEQDAEYVDIDEVDEVVEGDGEDEADPDEEEMAVDGEEAYADEGEEANEMEELHDDSVQGFFEHREPVYSVAINPSNQDLVVTGGGDDRSRVWNMTTGDEVVALKAHTDSVISVSFNHDGQYAASGGLDGKVNVYKSQNAEYMTTLEGPDEIVWMDWHPKGSALLAGGSDGTAWMWFLPKGNCLQVFTGHLGAVTCGMFSADGKSVMTGGEDGCLNIWDPKTGLALFKLTDKDARFHSGPITCMTTNKDSTLVLTGSDDATAKLVHLQNGKILGSLEAHEEGIETASFSEVLPYCATGGLDNKICIWDVGNMKCRQTFTHDDPVVKVRFHPSSHLLYSCSVDATIRVWDPRTGACEKVFRGHQAGVLDFDITNDGQKIVTASDDGTSLVFSLQ